MGRYLDSDLVEDFIKDNFKSRKDFVSNWGISYSHFLKMMESRGACGPKSLKKLEILLSGYDMDLEDLLEPVPMIIGDLKVLEIVVKDLDDNLLVYINSRKIINDKSCKLEYILK